jgi:hypothetical protein
MEIINAFSLAPEISLPGIYPTEKLHREGASHMQAYLL